MPRYIVRFRGSAPAKEITAQLHAAPAIEVLQETPRMVLLEANESDLLAVVKPGPDLVIVPERHYERPDSLPSLRHEQTKK
jgi:hypothetical protein